MGIAIMSVKPPNTKASNGLEKWKPKQNRKPLTSTLKEEWQRLVDF